MKIIYKDGHVDECPQDQELHVIRHTAAHVMAQAIKRLYPQADFAFGPATENGFYYDVDLGDQKLSDEDLANIEKEITAEIYFFMRPASPRCAQPALWRASSAARRHR